MSFLSLKHVRKAFGDSVAVESCSLEIERGEFVSFLGPSGCGKTTTLRMVAGFETPTAGHISLDGADITRVPPSKRHIGMVFQSYALFPNMTVANNIGFGLRVAGRPAAEIAARVAELLDVIHMSDFAARFPYQLSGGQQQRVALARALAIQPKVLLLDEPLSALDAKIRASLRQEIRSIQRRLNITTIYVTHDQEEAMALSDRVVVMSRGHVEQVGTPFDIYNFPQTPFVASFVGTLSTLKTSVIDSAAGVVEVAGQPIHVQRALGDLQPGAATTIAIRPERITVGAVAGQNVVRCVLDDVLFLGAIVRMRATIGDQVLAFDTFNNPGLSLPTPGSPLTVSFPPDACLVLDGNAPTAHLASPVDAPV